MTLKPYSINCNGRLFALDQPQVMGIINVTPDSFYADSRKQSDEAIAARARQIVAEGGTMIDIGAYSSRPGADEVSVEEEMERLRHGLAIVGREAPQAVVSVDTFRADVAKMCGGIWCRHHQRHLWRHARQTHVPHGRPTGRALHSHAHEGHTGHHAIGAPLRPLHARGVSLFR